MARTPGAKDKRPRKPRSRKAKPKSATKGGAKAGPQRAAATPADINAATRCAIDDVSASVDEFTRAIEAELRPQGIVSMPSGSGQASESAAQSADDDALLSRQAWCGVCRVPFRVLGRVLVSTGVISQADGIIAVGDKRAPDLARPSYVLFLHYAKEYARLNPDDPISLAWVATGLVGADIAEEIAAAILADRARGKDASAREPGTAADESQGRGSGS